jgi:hypothetical protein
MNKRRITKVEILMLPHPADQRERDEQAIKFLSECLDNGTPPGQRWAFGSRELWSAILRRRLADDYPREKDSFIDWRTRQFHVRQLYVQHETANDTAAHVARIWSKQKPATIKTEAQRKASKDRALEWIQMIEKQQRQKRRNSDLDIPDQKLVYAAIDRAITLIAENSSKKQKRKRTTAKTR